MNRTQQIKEDEAAVRLEHDIERDLVAKNSGPIAWVLAKAKMQAEDAKERLVHADPEDAKAIRVLQNEVWRQIELVTWLRDAIEEGSDAWNRLESGEKDAIVGELSMRDYEDA